MPAAPAAARVLKADRPHAGAGRPGFNLTDFADDCDRRLGATRDRCRALLAEAVAGADAVRESARAEGFAAGKSEGLKDAAASIDRAAGRAAEGEVEARLAAALPPLERLAAAYEAERQTWRAAWEPGAVRLACDLAARLLGRELAADPAAAVDLAGEALAAAVGSPAAAVTVSPAALEALGEPFAARVAAVLGPGATLAADASLGPGDCVVRTACGEVDGRLQTRLDRLAAELLPAADDPGPRGEP